MSSFLKRLFCSHIWEKISKIDFIFLSKYREHYARAMGFDYYICEKCEKSVAVKSGTIMITKL